MEEKEEEVEVEVFSRSGEEEERSSSFFFKKKTNQKRRKKLTCASVRNGISSDRVRSSPRASAIVDSLRTELRRRATSSFLSSSLYVF